MDGVSDDIWRDELSANLSLTLLNGTDNEGTQRQNRELLRKYETNRRLSDIPFYSFIGAYSLLIVIGAIGNCLVVSAVIRKATMRTARNMFIINLAVSDLLLCVITMPLTLIEILTQYWPFGSSAFPCKVYGSLQAISIFVSTISITAIALDRYHVIVYPTQASVQRVGAVVVLGLIWLISCILTSPLYMVRTVSHNVIPFFKEVNYCYEDWSSLSSKYGRAYYSVFAMIFQYALPIIVVSISYARISHKLRYRMKPGAGAHSAEADKGGGRGGEGGGNRSNSGKAKDTRVRKTNMLLIAIAIIFFISWMPINVFNVIVDLAEPFSNQDPEVFYICYAICHMIGMSSACSNPILYGWLNENFRKEFVEIANVLKSCCSRNENNNFNRDLRRGSSFRGQAGRNVEKEIVTTVHFKNNKATLNVEAVDCEQSTLITHSVDHRN